MLTNQTSCTIYYRTYGGENKAARPTWYSKELCLRSMLQAVELAKKYFTVNFIVLHDGLLRDNPTWSSSIRSLINPVGEVIELPKQNNAMSCLAAIHRADNHNDEDIIFFAEDDYLWLDLSIKGIVSALLNLPSHYVTGYDHPVRYQPDYPLGADYPHWHTSIYITEERHWRSQESTCMTFGAKAKTLKADFKYFEKYHNNGKNVPDDRKLFRHLCGLGIFQEQENPQRILLGPMPSLNTHANLPWLAPLVDWDAEANAIKYFNYSK